MVLQSIEQNNNNNTYYKAAQAQMQPVKQQATMAEAQMEHDLLAQIMHLLPEGYNIPQDITQFELIMATIQYINALQSLTAQYN